MILSSLMQDNKLESDELHDSSVNQIGFRLLSLSKIGLNNNNYAHNAMIIKHQNHSV